MTRRPRLTSECGAELVEFALIVPILLVLFGAMADFAHMFQRFLVATNAAREGARVAVLPGYGPADAQARARDYYLAGTGDTEAPTVTVSTVTIDPPGTAPAFSAAEVTVSATHNYVILSPLLGLIGGGPLSATTLTARTAMRVEGGV